MALSGRSYTCPDAAWDWPTKATHVCNAAVLRDIAMPHKAVGLASLMLLTKPGDPCNGVADDCLPPMSIQHASRAAQPEMC